MYFHIRVFYTNHTEYYFRYLHLYRTSRNVTFLLGAQLMDCVSGGVLNEPIGLLPLLSLTCKMKPLNESAAVFGFKVMNICVPFLVVISE